MATATIKTTKEAGLGLAELLRYKARNPGIETYQPHPKQTIFHDSEARKRLFIGGNRSGKTMGGAIEAIWYLQGKHPFKEVPKAPVRGRCVGTDFTQGVGEVMIPMIKKWMPLHLLIDGSWEASYERFTHKLTLSNGSTLEFMSYDQVLDKFAGTSRHFIWFDEEPPEDIYKECLMRLIDTKGDLWLTLTPVEGMTWLYDGVYIPGMNPEETSISVVEVATDENPYIDRLEIAELAKSFTEEELEARRKGKFVQRQGLIYKNFSYENNVIPPLAEIPLDRVHVAGMDHGLSNATAWVWAYVDADGNIIVYDEYYKVNEIVSTHAANVLLVNLDHNKTPDYCVGDPSIRNSDPLNGSSVQQEYAENGVFIGLANNNKSAGYSRVRKYIEGVDGRKLYVTSNCFKLIEQMSRLHWATYQNQRIATKLNAKEEQHKKEDHACDALRYLIMSRPEFNDTGSAIPEIEGMYTVGKETPNVEAFSSRIAKFHTKAAKPYSDPHLGEEF